MDIKDIEDRNVVTTVYIRLGQKVMIEKAATNGFNFSEWCRENLTRKEIEDFCNKKKKNEN